MSVFTFSIFSKIHLIIQPMSPDLVFSKSEHVYYLEIPYIRLYLVVIFLWCDDFIKIQGICKSCLQVFDFGRFSAQIDF